mmetsp:Transcript_5962/g.23134  ORF Transcript_5962/g.23134 Transcript_5962/m.23134 type:complete len:339 (+) Transcript_5962:1510-2526(+)
MSPLFPVSLLTRSSASVSASGSGFAGARSELKAHITALVTAKVASWEARNWDSFRRLRLAPRCCESDPRLRVCAGGSRSLAKIRFGLGNGFGSKPESGRGLVVLSRPSTFSPSFSTSSAHFNRRPSACSASSRFLAKVQSCGKSSARSSALPRMRHSHMRRREQTCARLSIHSCEPPPLPSPMLYPSDPQLSPPTRGRKRLAVCTRPLRRQPSSIMKGLSLEPSGRGNKHAKGDGSNCRAVCTTTSGNRRGNLRSSRMTSTKRNSWRAHSPLVVSITPLSEARSTRTTRLAVLQTSASWTFLSGASRSRICRSSSEMLCCSASIVIESPQLTSASTNA